MPPDPAWPVVPTGADASSEERKEVVELNGHSSEGSGRRMEKRSTMDMVSSQIINSLFYNRSKTFGQVSFNSGRKKFWIETAQADFFFGGWIVFNALVLAIETDYRTEENQEDAVWIVLDSLFNIVFLAELGMRMYAEKQKWYRDVWNIFDFCLVAIGVTDSWILPATGLDSDMRFITLMRIFRLFRLIRVLRVLRLLRFLKELMLLVQGITSAMRAMVWGLMLLAITIFISSLLLTRLVGKACCDPDDPFQDEFYFELFGTLPRTSFTLFQFTMEFQPDICRDTWDHGPWLTFFLLAYTMFTNITLLNTVASVIVDSILSISQANTEELKTSLEREEEEKHLEELSACFKSLDKDSNRIIDRKEMDIANPEVQKLLAMAGVSMSHAMNLFNIMDVDRSGHVSRDEFEALLKRGPHPPVEAQDIIRVQCQIDAHKQNVRKCFEDITAQNAEVLKVLSRLERKQVDMEDKILSVQQPDPRILDQMSVSFLPNQSASLALEALSPRQALPPLVLPSSRDRSTFAEDASLPGGLPTSPPSAAAGLPDDPDMLLV